VTIQRDQLIFHFFFREVFFSAADASLSIVCSFGLKPFAVISSKTTPNALTYSASDLDFIAMGLM
jgi:hypothetical protein